jgi:hypothetical protein
MRRTGCYAVLGFLAVVSLSRAAPAQTGWGLLPSAPNGAAAQTGSAAAHNPATVTSAVSGSAATAATTGAPPIYETVPVVPTPLIVAQATAPGAAPAPAPTMCTGPVDPYKNYACLDAYLGSDFWSRLINYYKLEWGQPGPPTDPNAGPSTIPNFPRIGATVPPMAYTDWPTGAVESIGDTVPNGADSPFMAAIGNTEIGQWMQANHFQVYGWIEPGFNISSNHIQPGGNGPIGYTYTPNTAQLDQAVAYLDRWVDTVQQDHFDWGERLSFLWGLDYRYTNSYGLGSYQFNGDNAVYGWDAPMEYVDFYWPGKAFFGGAITGLEIRIGRYISIPDIEAQLAPNNITFTHSLTYTWDNYTNQGIVTSWQINPNWMVQLGITDGTETPIWHYGLDIPNYYNAHGLNLVYGPDFLYPGSRYPKDPGNQPSATFCMQFKWNNGWDTFYPCLDGINDGSWGYNNLQWHGFTFYHRFNDQWHNDFETYYLSENGVPNLRNPTAVAIFENGGTPFSPQNVPFNPPNLAYCDNLTALKCNVHSIGVLDYINYTLDPLNNFTSRLEWYDDPEGWRTGTGGRTQYFDTNLSWQHWLSPQIEFRPEISWWRSVGTAAFDHGAHFTTVEFASDMIFHF